MNTKKIAMLDRKESQSILVLLCQTEFLFQQRAYRDKIWIAKRETSKKIRINVLLLYKRECFVHEPHWKWAKQYKTERIRKIVISPHFSTSQLENLLSLRNPIGNKTMKTVYLYQRNCLTGVNFGYITTIYKGKVCRCSSKYIKPEVGEDIRRHIEAIQSIIGVSYNLSENSITH